MRGINKLNRVRIKEYIIRHITERVLITAALLVLLYLLVALYFSSHFFYGTVLNGVPVSLKSHNAVDKILENHVQTYKLLLTERNGESEVITGQNIILSHNERNDIARVYKKQKSYQWITAFFTPQNYYVDNLFLYDKDKLADKIKALNCLNNKTIDPQNASFRYKAGTYETVAEVYGNKIRKDSLTKAITAGIKKGVETLNLEENQCYENPVFTLNSAKTLETLELLNKLAKTSITYEFGPNKERLDGSILNNWLVVDNNLNVVIDRAAIIKYVKALSKKYDTVGINRSFKSSVGKVIEVKGGIYGWKIDKEEEAEAIYEHILHGAVVMKEPAYAQKAVSREGNEIGDTYVEINITRQHVWFYKDGKLLIHGPVVTGNPNRGNPTVTGAYMLNYKQNSATLAGLNYKVVVKYWMPFYGNIGLHDASWRHTFGGEIYKNNGTHGCVNASLYLAKKIYENLEDGTPFISYKE
jgi:hypothetical protein